MAGEDLTVLIRGQATSLIKSFRDVSDAAGTSAIQTERSFAKVGQAVALAGAAIVGVAGAIGVASVKAAITFESSQARMSTAIKNTGGNFKDFAPQIDLVDKRMEKFGFTNSQTEDSIASLTNATHSTEKALSLQSLAADIARGRNIDLSTATQILTKVVTGHVALLGRLGIQTKDATGKTISQNEAVQRLAAMYGGQAAASAGTFGGKIAALKAELTDLAVKIGEKLIPILQGLADFVVNDVVPAAQSLWGWIKVNHQVFEDFGLLLAGAGLAALAAYAAELAVVAGEAIVAAAPIYLLVGAVGALALAAHAMGNTWQDVWNLMGNIAAGAINGIIKLVNTLVDVLNGAVDGINAITHSISKIPVVGSHLPKIPTIPDIPTIGFRASFTDVALNAKFPGSDFFNNLLHPTLPTLPTIKTPSIPNLGSEDFNTPGASGSGHSAAHTKAKTVVDDLTVAMGLLVPNVKFFEKQLQDTIHGVGATSAAAVAAADQFRAAQQSLLTSQLDTSDARRQLAIAKNDAPLARFAIQDARTQLINDSNFGADAETITKDQIALRDAQFNASKGTGDITRAQLQLNASRLAERTGLEAVTKAHQLLNDVLHGFPTNSVQIFRAMGAVAQALGGTLGVKGVAQHGPHNSVVINVGGHIVTEKQLEQEILRVLKDATNKQGVIRGVQTT